MAEQADIKADMARRGPDATLRPGATIANPEAGQASGRMMTPHERAQVCYSAITASGWDVRWRSENPVPDDAWPIDRIADTIRKAVAAEGRNCAPHALNLWRGVCGHHWMKEELNSCPICEVAALRRDMESLDDIRRQRAAARKAENKTHKVRIDIICMALDDAAEYFADRLDIRDGADGQQAPNDEMKLHTEIVSALHSLNGLRLSLERSEGDGSDTRGHHQESSLPKSSLTGAEKT